MSNQTKDRAVTHTNVGVRVVSTQAVDATAVDIFNIKGEVLITLLYGIVTGVGDGTAETIKLNEKASSIDLCAATTVTSDTVGQVYMLTGDPAIVLNGTANTPILYLCGLLSAFPYTGGIIFDGQAGLIMELTATAGSDATLAIKWVLYYIPLETGATVVAS